EQLIGEHTQVLRIALELDYVKVAVVSPHEVRLRAAAHSPYVLDRFHRHGGILAFCYQPLSEVPTPSFLKGRNPYGRKGILGPRKVDSPSRRESLQFLSKPSS